MYRVMAISRSHVLSQIMEIDKRISRVSKSVRYRKVQEYASLLSGTSGNVLVTVEDPKNMGELVRVRRNSPMGKEYLASYESLLREYNDMFNKLEGLKKGYSEQLFK